MNEEWRHDDQLLKLLNEAMAPDHGVPREVTEAGYAAFTLRDLDGELASLAFDSASADPSLAGVRSGHAGLRALTLASSTVTIELEVTSRSLLGQLVPAQVYELVVIGPHGHEHRIPVDDLGCFIIEPIPDTKFRLHVSGELNVKTDWLEI